MSAPAPAKPRQLTVTCNQCSSKNTVPAAPSGVFFQCSQCRAPLPPATPRKVAAPKKAEPDGSTSAVVGALGGVALGAAIAGPPGAIVGGVIGFLFGGVSKGIG